MKKRHFIVALFIIYLFISVNLTKANYSVSVNDVLEYKGVSSVLRASVDEEEVVNVNEPKICGFLFDNGTRFKINITYVSETAIIYNFICQSYQSIEYSLFKSNTMNQISEYLDYIRRIAVDIVLYPSTIEGYYSNGLDFLFVPIIDTQDETFNSLKNIDNDFVSSMQGSFLLDNFTIISEQKVSDKNNVFVIEWYITYTFSNNNDYDFKIATSLLIAYSKLTGILLGQKNQGYIRGKFSNQTIDIQLLQEIEEISYNLRDFNLGEFTTNNSAFWILGFIFGLITFNVIRKKSK